MRLLGEIVVPGERVDRRFHRLKWIVATCVLLLLLSCGSGTLAIWSLHPCRNEVQVTIKNIPVGTNHVCLIAESQGTVEGMDWTVRMIFPHDWSPDASWGLVDAKQPLLLIRNVVWKHGDRYGVAQRRIDGSWVVTWFAAEAVAPRNKECFAPGGEAVFDVSIGRTEPFPVQRVQQLRLQEMPQGAEENP